MTLCDLTIAFWQGSCVFHLVFAISLLRPSKSLRMFDACSNAVELIYTQCTPPPHAQRVLPASGPPRQKAGYRRVL